MKGKPENVIAKIVDGKMNKFYSTLPAGAGVHQGRQTVKDLVKSKIAELGENIIVRRFTRYVVGEPLSAEVVPSVQEEEKAA